MWKFYNANPQKNNVQDCVVRSISKAEGKTWDETYEELSKIAQMEGILLDDVDFVENYLDKRYRRQCHHSKLVGEFMEEHPKGTFLITMPNHITVIQDGILYDTFDCRQRRMWCAWNVPNESPR